MDPLDTFDFDPDKKKYRNRSHITLAVIYTILSIALVLVTIRAIAWFLFGYRLF